MGYQKRSKHHEAMPRPNHKPDGRCKKHPKHKQSPGVCSVCLSEKLSQLSTFTASTSSAIDSASSPSSSLSSYSTTSCSSCSSPGHRFRYAAEGNKGSLSFLLSSKNVLTKSRSLVFVSRTRGIKKDKTVDEGKKKGGSFLSKLLRPSRSKRIEQQEGLAHSRTMRERVMHIVK